MPIGRKIRYVSVFGVAALDTFRAILLRLIEWKPAWPAIPQSGHHVPAGWREHHRKLAWRPAHERGVLVISMRRQSLQAAVLVFLVVAVTSSVSAQDRLAQIASKKTISDRDRAVIAGEVAERVGRLVDAGRNSDRRASARDRLLATPRMKDATTAFRNAYADACGDELARVTTNDLREIAWEAVHVLEELDNAGTAEALATALKSSHADIRYRAAAGLKSLHKKLEKNAAVCRKILRALGAAGAKEKQEVVLPMIYRAVDFASSKSGGNLANDSAKALNKIFEARLKEQAAAKRSGGAHRFGCRAARKCYAAASSEQQKLLMRHMAGFLTNAVNRYFDADTVEGHRPTVATMITNIEDVVRAMVKASRERPPGGRISEAIKGAGSLADKERAARAAMGDLTRVLARDPWNLP